MKNFERVIQSFIANDYMAVRSVLEEEVELAKQKSHHNIVARLKRIISQIPSKKGDYIGSSATPQRIVASSEGQLYERINPDISLNDVVLNDDLRQIVLNFLHEWERTDELQKFGMTPSNKLILFGPPGTGKTKLAYAIANHLDLPLILVRLDELISSYLGKTGKNIREIFEIAKTENVVILLDEIDTIAKNRADQQDLGELKRVVTVFLQNIDMMPANSIVIGATNHENLLDKAIWRRFPLKLDFDLPEKNEREKLLNLFMRSRDVNDFDTEMLAELTEGLNGSALYDFCQQVIRTSILEPGNEGEQKPLIVLMTLLGRNGTNRKEIYRISRYLYEKGFKLKELEKISKIPYTTLREHVS